MMKKSKRSLCDSCGSDKGNFLHSIFFSRKIKNPFSNEYSIERVAVSCSLCYKCFFKEQIRRPVFICLLLCYLLLVAAIIFSFYEKEQLLNVIPLVLMLVAASFIYILSFFFSGFIVTIPTKSYFVPKDLDECLKANGFVQTYMIDEAKVTDPSQNGFLSKNDVKKYIERELRFHTFDY